LASKQSAWDCVRESLHDFRLFEWAPFGWILLFQALFLLAILNLGSAWGMVIGGGVAGLVGRGEQIVHYPTVFIFLPALSSIVEWFLYVVVGSVLIPIALLRIAAPMESDESTDWRARVRRAALPTLLAGLMNVGLLQLWDWTLSRAVVPAIQSQIPGLAGTLAPWLIGATVSYALAAPFLYVPIRAIRRDATFASALFGGLKEGVRLFWPTLLVILICSWPAFLVLAGAQVNPAVIVRKMRPELVGYLLLAYAVITSFASYLIYASASRLRWARQAA
jgi:hypothetical protein